jgi:hypothetical protein
MAKQGITQAASHAHRVKRALKALEWRAVKPVVNICMFSPKQSVF